MKHWLIIALCVCPSTVTVNCALDDDNAFIDRLAAQTVKRTDAYFKDKELIFQQQLEALDDKIWILGNKIDLMELKRLRKESR